MDCVAQEAGHAAKVFRCNARATFLREKLKPYTVVRSSPVQLAAPTPVSSCLRYLSPHYVPLQDKMIRARAIYQLRRSGAAGDGIMIKLPLCQVTLPSARTKLMIWTEDHTSL
jgi:hypothetical protein